MTKQRDIVDVLTSFILRERFERIPGRVRSLARIHIIDGVGVALAGAATPLVRSARRSALGGGESRSGLDVIATGPSGSPALVAYSNALSARILDYDDVQTSETSIYGLLGYPSAPVLAAALAIGQWREVSGESLLSAYLAGVEVRARLADAVNPKLLRDGLPATGTLGGIGALFAAAKLLGLGRKAIRSALSIWETIRPRDGDITGGAVAVAFRDAQSVRTAVEAALLAAEGVTADTRIPSVLTVLPVAKVTEELAKPYYILKPGFAIRTYPCNPLAHPAVDLLFTILNLNDIRPREIKRVDVDITRVMGEVLLLTAPTRVVELTRSLPYAIALAACKGAVVPEDFRRLPKRGSLRDFMQRIYCRVAPELDALGHERARTVVRVTLGNGRVIQMKTDVAKGTPEKPFSDIELSHKFLQCALYSIGPEQAEELLNRLWFLEESPNVAALFNIDDMSIASPTDHSAGAIHHHVHSHIGHETEVEGPKVGSA